MNDCPPLIIECSLPDICVDLCWVLGFLLPHSSYKDELLKMHDASLRVAVTFDSQVEFSKKEHRANEDWSIYLLSWTMQTFVDALVVLRKFLLVGITVCVAAVLVKLYCLIYQCGLVLVLFIHGKTELLLHVFWLCGFEMHVCFWYRQRVEFVPAIYWLGHVEPCINVASMLTSLCIGLAIALVSVLYVDNCCCQIRAWCDAHPHPVDISIHIYIYIYIYM